ncbi:MAG: hypothetical protein ACYDHM_00880 [Acidiferrobacterales bacterium]
MHRQLLVLVSAFMLSGCIAQALTSGHVAFSDEGVSTVNGTVPRIGARERMLIRDYCANRAHAGDFPRGVLDQRMISGLRRGHHLPRGLAYRSLPRGLERRLPRLPQPYARVMAGTDVLVINRHNGMIVDLAREVCDPAARLPPDRYAPPGPVRY